MSSTKAFNNLRRESLFKLAGGPLSDWAWRKVTLSSTMGKLNLRSAFLHSPAAFISSLDQSHHLVERILEHPLLPHNISLKLSQLLQRQQGCLDGFVWRELCAITSASTLTKDRWSHLQLPSEFCTWHLLLCPGFINSFTPYQKLDDGGHFLHPWATPPQQKIQALHWLLAGTPNHAWAVSSLAVQTRSLWTQWATTRLDVAGMETTFVDTTSSWMPFLLLLNQLPLLPEGKFQYWFWDPPATLLTSFSQTGVETSPLLFM